MVRKSLPLFEKSGSKTLQHGFAKAVKFRLLFVGDGASTSHKKSFEGVKRALFQKCPFVWVRSEAPGGNAAGQHGFVEAIMFSERGFGGEAPDIMCPSKKTQERFLFLCESNNLPSPDGEGGNRRLTGGETPVEFLISSLKSFL